MILETLTVVVTALAAIGGILALPDQIKKLRTGRHPLGFRSTTIITLSRESTTSGTTVRILVADDVFKALRNMMRFRGAQFISIQSVGDLFDIALKYPPGADLRHHIVDEKI